MAIVSYLILFEHMLHHEESPEKPQYSMATPISRQKRTKKFFAKIVNDF